MPIRSAISRVPQRWIVCVLCSLALAFISCKNYCYHATHFIVLTTTENKRNSTGGCPFLFFDSSWERRKLPLTLPIFFWSPDLEDLANSAFFAGKVMMIVPAGVISDLGFSRYVLCLGMLLMTGRFFLLPAFARFGATVYVVGNFFDGVGEALVYPSIFTVLSHWVPPWERNFFTALVAAGMIYGDTLARVFFKLTFLQFESWSVGYLISGTIGLLWLGFGFFFIYHLPGESPFRHPNEFSIGSGSLRKMTLPDRLIRLQSIPWQRIVCSRSYLSLVLAFYSVNWAAWANMWGTFQDYQKYILHLPDYFCDESTVMVAFAVVPASLLVGWFTDWVVIHRAMSKIVVVKVLVFVGVFLSSILQVVAVSAGCRIMLFWVLYMISGFSLGFASLIYANAMDLSLRHAGLSMALMFGIRTVGAIFTSKVDRMILTDSYDSGQWWIYTVFNSSVTSALVVPFLVFGSGKSQNWRRQTSRFSSAPGRQRSELADGATLERLETLPTPSSSIVFSTESRARFLKKWF